MGRARLIPVNLSSFRTPAATKERKMPPKASHPDYSLGLRGVHHRRSAWELGGKPASHGRICHVGKFEVIISCPAIFFLSHRPPLHHDLARLFHRFLSAAPRSFFFHVYCRATPAGFSNIILALSVSTPPPSFSSFPALQSSSAPSLFRVSRYLII